MDKFVFVKGKKDQSLDMITARIESGLSIREWCKINGITIGTYDYHACKLRKLGLYPGMENTSGKCQRDNGSQLSESISPQSSIPAFAEIPVSNHGGESHNYSQNPKIIVECGAFKISVCHNASIDMIRSVMEVAAGVH